MATLSLACPAWIPVTHRRPGQFLLTSTSSQIMVPPTPTLGADVRARTLYFLRNRKEWNHWPFLPVVRRSSGTEELGVVFDCFAAGGPAGYSCTVWATNLFLLPRRLDQFLMLPKEVFDVPEELTKAGWVVD